MRTTSIYGREIGIEDLKDIDGWLNDPRARKFWNLVEGLAESYVNILIIPNETCAFDTLSIKRDRLVSKLETIKELENIGTIIREELS